MPETEIRTRPWTQHLSPAKLYRKQRADIKIPVINTYEKQLKKCNQLYNRVTEEFYHSEDKLPVIINSNLHVQQQRPSFTKSAPGTFYFDQPDAVKSLELSLAKHFQEKRHHTDLFHHRRYNHDFAESDTVSEYSDTTEINPFKLSEILYRRGKKKPLLAFYDKNGVEIRKHKSRIIRPNNGALPKNPSAREKIKGRARLDYEMANMRAAAFCEQQAQRKFRTASANMRNRDVELVEEDFLERINKEENDKEDINDDTGSIIIKIDKEELFERIDKWIDDVNLAFGTQSNLTSKMAPHG